MNLEIQYLYKDCPYRVSILIEALELWLAQRTIHTRPSLPDQLPFLHPLALDKLSSLGKPSRRYYNGKQDSCRRWEIPLPLEMSGILLGIDSIQPVEARHSGSFCILLASWWRLRAILETILLGVDDFCIPGTWYTNSRLKLFLPPPIRYHIRLHLRVRDKRSV